MVDSLIHIVIFFPLLAGGIAFFLHDKTARLFGVSSAIIELAFMGILAWQFDTSSVTMQFQSTLMLIPLFGFSYSVGVDGISLTLMLLNAIVIALSIVFLHRQVAVRHFVACLLVLESILMGVFSAQNLLLFYVFWELSLLPILYIIGVWGSGKKLQSALQFFLYTFFASLIMLLGILYYGFLFFSQQGYFSFELADWLAMPLTSGYQSWLFLAFFFAVAVKIPMIPFHSWLPRTYGDAPTLGTAVLSALLLKMGTYALVRFCIPLFPDASVEFSMWILILALVMILYGAMLAYAQKDIKQVIAYSSVSHMGVVVLGVFSFTIIGLSGAVFMMFAHGIVAAVLFMMVGAFSERVDSREIGAIQGVASVAPIFCALFGIALMANVGLPLTIGFVGEFLSLLGIFAKSPLIAFIGGITIILSAAYMLVLYRKMFFGTPSHNIAQFFDITPREKLVFSVFVAFIIGLGIYPKPLLALIDSGTKPLLENAHSRAITHKDAFVLEDSMLYKRTHKQNLSNQAHSKTDNTNGVAEDTNLPLNALTPTELDSTQEQDKSLESNEPKTSTRIHNGEER